MIQSQHGNSDPLEEVKIPNLDGHYDNDLPDVSNNLILLSFYFYIVLTGAPNSENCEYPIANPEFCLVPLNIEKCFLGKDDL